MVALVTGNIWCACVYVCTYLWILEGYYGMAKYVHFIYFQCLFICFSAILSHIPSCIVRAGFCNRWDLGQACSLVTPCQTWGSHARQVVPKTCNIHRRAQFSPRDSSLKLASLLVGQGHLNSLEISISLEGEGHFWKSRWNQGFAGGAVAFLRAFRKVASFLRIF